MPKTQKTAPRTAAQAKADAALALAWLEKNRSKKVLEGMARYGLPSDKALGVSVGAIQKYGKQLGRDQALADALWATDVYEARLLASFVGEPDKLTPAVMDRWCRDFDNWGVVDTVCFKLFDQSPHAWDRIEPWAGMKGEFQRRAGFVLLACVAAHVDAVPNEKFLRYLPLLEWGATDERNFVKKGVSWALRMVGRQGPGLRHACGALAKKLTESDSDSARWIGREALREFAKR
ncbi:MAG TPA: DNA alkylation repair protein [Lacunisphaera sp.]|nr:DNA alkylation repair protein [Lacunisphaera sp.]